MHRHTQQGHWPDTDLPRHVAQKQHSGSPSCTLSAGFYIISRHWLGTATTSYATRQRENNNN